jgi:hypothetical protein
MKGAGGNMRITVPLFAIWFAAATVALGQAGQQSDAGNPRFSVAISVAADVFKVDAEPTLKIVMANTSDHHIKLPDIQGNEGHIYRVNILDSQGKPALQVNSRTLHGENGRPVRHIYMGGNATTVDLDPGQTVTDECRLDKRYDLTKPGKYTIQASRYDSETKTWVKSNTITVTVTQ